MCGITGILEFDRKRQVPHALVQRACEAMIHRGPDDQGVYIDGNAGLGMRRLSIIDLASGHQPLSNEDGTIWIVFNGEIYNQSELRRELIGRGHIFRSNSDTEVIVHLYEEYGRDCVLHLSGMFAFAIWNSPQRRLFVARDRMGIKPLYYRLSKESFTFGSEIKVLFAYPGLQPELRTTALPEYLAFGYLSGSETFYRGISKLMPGNWLEINEHGACDLQQYWDLHTPEPGTSRGEAYYVKAYLELLDEAVATHLMSDVPVGAFLSGGLDSSAVAALMTRSRPDPIKTFSVGYKEQKFSELPFAREVSRFLGSDHHEVLVSRQEFFDVLPRLIWHEDEPIAWPSSVALYFVARLAQEHVKVVLTGEGSDETLGGYSRYAYTIRNLAWDRVYRRMLPGGARDRVRDFISDSTAISAGLRRRLSHTFLARDGQCWDRFYFDNFFSAFSESEQEDLLANDVMAEMGAGAVYGHVLSYWEGSSGEMLHRLLYTDIKTYLVELLMKQDSMSMAASIESRVPFLDHKLVEFAVKIPQHLQIRGLAGKTILKKAMRGLLPDTIIDRKKLGFPTPWDAWLAGPQFDAIQGLLTEPRSLHRRLFKPDAVARLFQEHRTRRRDHSNRIWRLLNLELWQRTCLEREDARPADSYSVNERVLY